MGDGEKLSVRKEGNGSWWFSPKKGWEAQSSQTQKLYLGTGKNLGLGEHGTGKDGIKLGGK